MTVVPLRGWAVRIVIVAAAMLTAVSDAARGQSSPRLAVLQAENRRAPTVQDLATLRIGARSADPQTARVAVRALGRLERPALVADILPGLRHRLPEVRAEAASAIAQATQGLVHATGGAATLTSAQTALLARLDVDDDAGVRAAVCEAIARLPYRDAADVTRAETRLVAFAERAASSTDRLGLAKGLEVLARLQHAAKPLDAGTVDLLKQLARNDGLRPDAEALRDARVRRLALEALTAISAADAGVVLAAGPDPDPQVRRLAVRAAATIDAADAVIMRGLTDPAGMVRVEALRALRTRNAEEACDASIGAASDPDTHVALVAIDQLGACRGSGDAASLLERFATDADASTAPRNWHRAAHAIVALAATAPDRAAAPLTTLAAARVWQLRMYAARAAAGLRDSVQLEHLARDPHANVAEAALSGLTALSGHDADRLYIAALSRDDFQIVRTAALALERSPSLDAVPALTLALQRVESDPRPGAADTRAALRATLESLGVAQKAAKPVEQKPAPLNVADLRRLAAPRARFTIRDVGVFDVALFTLEAPATVLQFAELAASGYYDGLSFHRIVPNGIVQGGGPGDNEYGSSAPLMRDEVGLWPHVRGALGISTRGRDTGDGQIFIDLVDNPRYDHTYTVFAQVLNGLDVVDRILEGDVIDRIEILP